MPRSFGGSTAQEVTGVTFLAIPIAVCFVGIMASPNAVIPAHLRPETDFAADLCYRKSRTGRRVGALAMNR